MQQTVRAYLDEHGIEADRVTCRHLSAQAKRLSALRKFQVGRVREHKQRAKYVNVYEVEILDLVCRNYVGLKKASR